MRSTVDILGVKIDKITMKEALERIESFLDKSKIHTIYTPNSEIMMAAQRDPQLKAILCQGDMVVADGAGVVLASRMLGLNLPEKVSGFDLVKNILKTSTNKEVSFFLFGGKPGIAEAAGEKILRSYPGIRIAGSHNGYFSEEEEDAIIEKINSSNADFLLVALGAPKQEKWINEHKDRLKVKVCIGVGGTLDVLSGKTKLAPEFFRKNGLEWMYRLYKEPWRFKRMLDLPRFMFLVISHKLKKLFTRY